MNAILDKEIKDSFSVIRLEQQAFEMPVLHRISYHRIFLIEKGHGNIFIDGNVFPVSGSELFLLAKGQVYRFDEDTILTGYELCFGDCFWEKTPASASNCKAALFNNVNANQHITLDEDHCAELLALFRSVFLEYSGNNYINKPDAMAAYLKIIMIKIANINAALTDAYDSYEKQLYRGFIALVGKQYHTTHEVADFARQLNIPARKLADICKQCSGKGAKEIINEQIIAEAKRFLQFSSKPVKEIAFELNFSTPDQFSHFFKRSAGVSPHRFRAHFVQIGM